MAQRINSYDNDDEDGYWSGSSIRRNFFDDNDDSQTSEPVKSDSKSFAVKLKEAHLDDPDESLDTVDWLGNVVKSEKRAPPMPPSQPSRPSKPPTLSARGSVNVTRPPKETSSSTAAVSVRYSKPVERNEADSISISSSGSQQTSQASEMSHRRSASDASGTRKFPDTPSPTVSADSASSIDEAIRRDSKPTIAETSRLIAENNQLERRVKSLEKSKWSSASIADTVSRMITGEKCSLEPYKSLKDKLSLLDAVVGYHDGNAILAVVIFLRRTLKKSLFHQELQKRPDAVNQYLAFLKVQNDEDVAKEMGCLARTDDAAMWRFKMASEKVMSKERQTAISSCYQISFRGIESRDFEGELVNEYSMLLEKQNEIEPRDDQLQREGRPPFREMPRKASLYFQPLITTIFYCCLYHYMDPAESVSHPHSFKRDFKLTDKQYLYTALRARSKVKDWNSIDALFLTKNLIGKAKLKAPMKFEKIVEVLAGMKSPVEIIEKYLKLVEDSEVRLEVAKRYKCSNVIIDTLVELKDRQRLIEYQGTTKDQNALNRLAIVLRTSSIKWKN